MNAASSPMSPRGMERIEFARLHRSTIVPRKAGEPLSPYSPRDLDAWQGRDVPTIIADVCRELSRRGPHGVYVDKLGGPDILAELDLYGLPYKVVNFVKRGQSDTLAWVVADAVFRFAEDRESVG